MMAIWLLRRGSAASVSVGCLDWHWHAYLRVFLGDLVLMGVAEMMIRHSSPFSPYVYFSVGGCTISLLKLCTTWMAVSLTISIKLVIAGLMRRGSVLQLYSGRALFAPRSLYSVRRIRLFLWHSRINVKHIDDSSRIRWNRFGLWMSMVQLSSEDCGWHDQSPPCHTAGLDKANVGAAWNKCTTRTISKYPKMIRTNV